MGKTLVRWLQYFPRPHLIGVASCAALVVTISLFVSSEPVTANLATTAQVQNAALGSERISQQLAAATYTSPAPLAELNVTKGQSAQATLALAAPVADFKPTTAVQSMDTDLNTEVSTSELRASQVVVKSGDSLAAIFSRQGLSAKTLYTLVNTDKQTKQLAHIKPGQQLTFWFDNEDNLQALDVSYSSNKTLKIHHTRQGFSSQWEERPIERQVRYAEATIEHSLFLAGKAAGLADNVIMELANTFAWDIDFALDIRPDDNFKLLYEELHLDGEPIGYGDILAAEFTNQGRTVKAIRYTDSQGKTDYYSADGRSMRKAFIRSPVKFTRISSRFSLARKHPVLHKIRAHRGVDYAAARGTPVKASGDGKVVFAGRKGGYGRTVVLQHGQRYTTLYAHLNGYARGVRSGRHVKQGQTIGYVGSSGLATGPHLHYEFRVNGVHRDPLRVKLPDAQPIAKQELARFNQHVSTVLAELSQHSSAVLALNEEP